MRIKLNLMQMIPNKNPSIYWLHINVNCIVYIKHLKEKIKKVLKETRDIELCLDGVLFLDEDDIDVIHENEEIIVIVKENNTELNKFDVDMNVLPFNGNLSTELVELNSENDNACMTSSIPPKISKKRLRKRTHKKKEPSLKPIEQFENSDIDMIAKTSIISPIQTGTVHKRFKLNNDDFSNSESLNEDHFYITNEVFHCNSSPLNTEKINIEPVRKKEKTKVTKVPVYVRGQTLTSNNLNNSSYSENENHINTISNTIENNEDIEVVDWKTMSKIKIKCISELQMHDILQFKILVMNELGEAAVSSTITARLEHISENTLLINVLSGMKEFVVVNHKFNMDNEEDVGTQREIEFQDLFELVKLI